MPKNRFSLKSWYAKRKFVRKQLISKPSFYSPDSWVTNWTPFYWTTNEVVQTLSRLMLWDDTKKRWLLARCDTSGNLITTPDMRENEAKDVVLFADQVISPSSLITHTGEDVSGYSKKELIVSTTGNCNIYVQFSNDNENWYTWYDVQDVNVYFTCDGEKKAWEIIDHGHYVRILIYNSSASNVTVSAALMCQV